MIPYCFIQVNFKNEIHDSQVISFKATTIIPIFLIKNSFRWCGELFSLYY